MITKHDAEMLKAWFSAHALEDVHEELALSDVTFDSVDGFSLERVRNSIDEFVASKENT